MNVVDSMVVVDLVVVENVGVLVKVIALEINGTCLASASFVSGSPNSICPLFPVTLDAAG